MLKNHEIKREYIAIVRGIIKENSGTIDAPIGRDEKDRKKYKVTNLNSKPAVTHFNVVERLKNHTIVKLKLETGRTHQIRAHFASIGHPLAGDGKYGKNAVNKGTGFPYQALYSYKLRFDFQSDGGLLSYLDGKEFTAGDVWFLPEFEAMPGLSEIPAT